MTKYVFIVVLFALSQFIVQAQVHVTFRVNMAAKVYNRLWDPATDSVTLRGSFQEDAGDPNGAWNGFYFRMSLLGDTVYGVTVTFPTSKIGTAYEYRYIIGPDSWEGALNRSFTCPTKDSVLAVNWFSNDSTRFTKFPVTNTVTFNADLSSMSGSGLEYLENNTDSLLVIGIDSDGHGTLISGNRKMVEDSQVIGLFKTTLKIKGIEGDSCKWKFRFYPAEKFVNAGYERNDRWIVFQPEGTTTILPIITPYLVSPPPIIVAPVTTLFECNMNNHPVNAKNGREIPLDSIAFIGLKGGISQLGSWGGNWTEADTAGPDPAMIVLHDDGFFGDKIAGDKIFSRNITFPAGTTSGAIEFKFAASYPAAYEAGDSTPLDNEGSFGSNHLFRLSDGKPTNLQYYFGSYIIGVNDKESISSKFNLAQNYPNPFNPATRITFSVPSASKVHLTVFDLLGREVATLVNEVKTSGSYSVDFNASNLPSGIYLYKLTAGSNSITKKMLLLK